MKNLQATTQKSYYGKAKIYEKDGRIILRSYNTDVIAIDVKNGCFERLWNGYSKTTMAHINDFLRLYNMPSINKKEWFGMPCESSEPVYNIYTSAGFYTHKSTALLTSEECESNIEKIYNDSNGRLTAWYE